MDWSGVKAGGFQLKAKRGASSSSSSSPSSSCSTALQCMPWHLRANTPQQNTSTCVSQLAISPGFLIFFSFHFFLFRYINLFIKLHLSNRTTLKKIWQYYSSCTITIRLVGSVRRDAAGVWQTGKWSSLCPNAANDTCESRPIFHTIKPLTEDTKKKKKLHDD